MVAYRIVLTAVLALYLVAVIAAGFVVLSPALDVPFALTGWLLFAGPAAWAIIGRRTFATDDLLADLLRPWPLTLAFITLLLIASYFAIAWQVPPQCHGNSLSCLKGYQWTDVNGVFSRIADDGTSEQISRSAYIAEVGVHLRSAAAFGMYSLVFAWAAAIALKRVGH